MARFVVDAQLPPALALQLTRAGHISEHVTRIGLAVAADTDIWRYVARAGAALITKDEDFVAMARANPNGPQVVWIRLGNISNNALWTDFERVLDEVIHALDEGERIIEVV